MRRALLLFSPRLVDTSMDKTPTLFSRRRFHCTAGVAIAATAVGALSGCASSRDGMAGMAGGASAAGTGAAGMGASAAGLDWLEIVKTEHRAVDAMFAELMRTTDADLAKRATLRDRIADALTNHAVEEENVLYPALQMAGIKAESQQLFREHAEVKVMLAELEMMPKDHPGWLARARQLQASIQKHVADEENRIYPGFKARLSPEQNMQVTRMYLREGAKYAGA